MENVATGKHFKLIACGVLKKEIDSVLSTVPSNITIDAVFLEQGLHREPDRLNSLIKDEIAAAESGEETFDAILLAYGVCSRGTLGISSQRFPIVIPRAHDCITLFLGSKERYLEEFSSSPGTYWFTPGFISGSVQPGMSEKYAGVYQEFEKNYENYLDRFGDKELARYIIDQQEQAWIKNYSRGAYVKSGLKGGKALKEKAQKFCEIRGWFFEEVAGDFELIRKLLSGKWDTETFLILQPGEISLLGSVDEIITAHTASGENTFFGEDYRLTYWHDGVFRELPPSAELPETNTDIDIVLGIDAGGTYTDAVALSLESGKVLASAKSPTTHHDLAIGIRNALQKLPIHHLRCAGRIAISTTLATNAIVEEKGARTGLILIGYAPDTVSMVAIGSGDIKEAVTGCHDIYGTEIESLDTEALFKTVDSMIGKGVEAIAISSYMATRNPEHEITAKSIVTRHHSLPVVMGHELTDDMDSVRRAHTVLLNARLLPVISSLIHSIKSVAQEMSLTDDIRLVTTDGTLMNTVEALEKPVRLVLSGPAASVKGVRYLTDLNSCVLIDMGGTTSDIAVIEGGSARRTGRGAVVGKYRTSIKATDIRTMGLGGDSGIAWKNNRIHVGPERVVPVSTVSAEYPGIIASLKSMQGYEASDYGLVQPGTHLILMRRPENISFLNDREKALIAILEEGPASLVTIAEKLVYPYLSLIGSGRLEELGYIRKCGLTPTDLMVIDGRIDWMNDDAARVMLGLYAERSGMNADTFASEVWNEVRRMAASAVISEVLTEGSGNGSFPGCHFCERSFSGSAAIDVVYRLNYPLVGIGAPSEMMLAGLGKYLAADMVFPKEASVANAVGAASGTGGMHLDMTIMTDTRGRFTLYTPDGVHFFRTLQDAKAEAVRRSRECALDYAKRMNYKVFSLEIHVRDRSAPTAFGTDIYIDTSVVSTLRY